VIIFYHLRKKFLCVNVLNGQGVRCMIKINIVRGACLLSGKIGSVYLFKC
jgi:hypothetical protein